MRHKTRYKMPHRRVREGRTDYRQRLKLLKSGKHRLVIRRSSNNLVCQIIQHDPKGDRTAVTASIQTLKALGWKGHGGNISSAYLIGLACGVAAKKKGVNEAVADTGLFVSTKGSSIYAALKGVVDSGLHVPHSKEILPTQDRLEGRHVSGYAEALKKENPEKYSKLFSGYLKNKLPPEELAKHFQETKAKLK